jgi:hypothetical protein
MTLLVVLLVLAALVVLACWRDARRGRAQWGDGSFATADAARQARRPIVTTVALGAFLDAGGDGG